jgi:hypothetical protein
MSQAQKIPEDLHGAVRSNQGPSATRKKPSVPLRNLKRAQSPEAFKRSGVRVQKLKGGVIKLTQCLLRLTGCGEKQAF